MARSWLRKIEDDQQLDKLYAHFSLELEKIGSLIDILIVLVKRY